MAMASIFSRENIKEIEKVLGVSAKEEQNHFKFMLDNPKEKRWLSLEVYPEIKIGSEIGNLISVYASNAHLQLHFCVGYVVSEMLDEVTFISEEGGRLCGLIIEKGAGCSLYANVDRKILSGDFTALGPEVMLSGIALSLSEDVIEND